MSLLKLRADLKQLSDPQKAVILQRFFKTGPGEYAHGDRFLGVVVPRQREVARKYRQLSLPETVTLLKSSFHEERLVALFILVDKFKRADDQDKKRIYDLYLRHTRFINNWDLVDSSADKIVGPYLEGRDQRILIRLARSRSLWERRIAMLATFYFIKKGNFVSALKVAQILLTDPHHLIHKAVGWMLREIGKRDLTVEEHFLSQHCQNMPRTMLRYAIERFPKAKRLAYLQRKK